MLPRSGPICSSIVSTGLPHERPHRSTETVTITLNEHMTISYVIANHWHDDSFNDSLAKPKLRLNDIPLSWDVLNLFSHTLLMQLAIGLVCFSLFFV
jgi:hypothetical protein